MFNCIYLKLRDGRIHGRNPNIIVYHIPFFKSPMSDDDEMNDSSKTKVLLYKLKTK